MILFWELLNVYWTDALRFIGLKKFLKVYSMRKGIKDSVFYLLINRHDRWGGGRYEDWIHSSRSTLFLTWRYLKIYLHGIVYKTKHLSNGCKQQIVINTGGRKQDSIYIVMSLGSFLNKILVLLYNPDGVYCRFCYISLIFTQFFIMEIHVVSSQIKSTKFYYVIFSSLEIYILIKYWFKKYITTISTYQNKTGFTPNLKFVWWFG